MKYVVIAGSIVMALFWLAYAVDKMIRPHRNTR